MERIDKVEIILSYEDKKRLEKYGVISKYDSNDNCLITVRYDS